jgi:neutral ceramidase
MSAETAEAFEAGAAKVEITPPLGVPLNGYGERMGRGALSVHDPLWARCLYLDDGDTKVFLVNADLCLISPELRTRVLELAPKIVPSDHIILTATHTHNGPGGMSRPLPFRLVSGRFMPDLLENTARKIASVMQAAYDARKTATIGYGTAQQQVLSKNRRHDDGPIDEQIGVIRVDDAEGKNIAIVANFAAHPTLVPSQDLFAISADYPGVFYNELEAMSDPGSIALFTNGAEGNQACADPEKHGSRWSRIDSIGRLLAIRVKETANAIQCGVAKLRVASATVDLPPTASADFVPSKAFLQILEINDLLITFVPGEPCVEIGLELRRQARERGYAEQFTVGLANDYLGYFVPAECYSHPEYEAGMNFYGPRIAEWCYREFGKLMDRGEAPPEKTPPAPAPAEPAPLGEVRRVVLAGSSYEIGYARGALLAEEIRQAFQERIVAPVESGAAIPDDGWWKLAPPFLDLTPVALTRLATGARPFLGGLSEDIVSEVEGLAAGAGLPFDAAWLLQCAPVFGEEDGAELFYRAPYCTLFAVVGEKAGGGLIVGRNLDWKDPEPPLVVEYRPRSGRRFVQVGFNWNVGVFTGMNEAGLVVCAERALDLGNPSADGAPVEFVLRDVLQKADNVKEAVGLIGAAKHLRGYRVLVADPGMTDTQVIDLGRWVGVRKPKDGLLFGSDPADKDLEASARMRYARAAELLGTLETVTVADAERVLRDAAPAPAELGSILNPQTRHSVVFEPRARRMRIAVTGEDGRLGPSATFNFDEEDAP